MKYKTISVQKLSPSIGAEIEGVDLTKPLSQEQFEEVYAAWMDNLVILFRDQDITVEQHKQFGLRFGEPHIHPVAAPLKEHPEIIAVSADENSTKAAGEEWHTDVSCDVKPPMGSVLHLTEVPPDGGGDTLFANMYLAFETLSDPVKGMLCGLSAVHEAKGIVNQKGYLAQRGGYRENIVYPEAEHPVVRTHPITGRQAIYVNRVFTTKISGMSENESKAILDMLFHHIELPQFQTRLKWQKHTLVCWDNRCAQHRAIFDYFPHRRYGQRFTIKGDKPVYVPDK